MTNDRGQDNVVGPASTRFDVVLIGDGPTALAALRSLMASCRVVHILRTAANPATDPVYMLAATAGIPVSALRGLEHLAQIVAELRPAAVAISSFNRILPPSILALSQFVNVHYSPLPRYRGRANVNWSIINGEPDAGISIHRVVPDLDGGNLLFQGSVPIGSDDTATSIYNRLDAIQERELGAAVVRAVAGDLGISQDRSLTTYGCSRVPDDGEIDWRKPTDTIDRLIRALAPPFPGAFTHLETQQLVISRAAPLSNPLVYTGRVPGRVVGLSRTEGWVDVLSGDGILRIFEVIPSSPGTPIPAATLIRSTRVTLGLSRLDLLRRIMALEERLALLLPPGGAGSDDPRL
ncbi:MAG: methionyl-tRNA formyltransferase [Bradyrhizobium sp.]|nr:methionyl-tRNA formyltransferase [Bradyrhizobium sp.]